MSGPSSGPGSGLPRWFAPAIVLLISLQLGLLWVQGGLLNHQRQEIRALREDILSLADLIDQAWGAEPMEEMNPARTRPHRPRLLRVGVQNPEDEDKAARELQASRQSAQEAKTKAEETQKKLSLSENYRLGQEAQRREAEQHKWTRLAGMGLAGALVLFILIRIWLRRR